MCDETHLRAWWLPWLQDDLSKQNNGASDRLYPQSGIVFSSIVGIFRFQASRICAFPGAPRFSSEHCTPRDSAIARFWAVRGSIAARVNVGLARRGGWPAQGGAKSGQRCPAADCGAYVVPAERAQCNFQHRKREHYSMLVTVHSHLRANTAVQLFTMQQVLGPRLYPCMRGKCEQYRIVLLSCFLANNPPSHL